MCVCRKLDNIRTSIFPRDFIYLFQHLLSPLQCSRVYMWDVVSLSVVRQYAFNKILT